MTDLEGRRPIRRNDVYTSHDRGWPINNSPISGTHLGSYERVFRNVLNEGESIADLLQGIKEPNVIDLMSGTYALHTLWDELPEDQRKNAVGAAVAIGPWPHQRSQDDEIRHIKQFEGNILYKGTWMRLENHFKNHGDGKANLIMAKPEGAALMLTTHPDIYYFLIQNAYDLLSSDNGTLLTQLPSRGFLQQHSGINIDSWLNSLTEAGIQTNFYELQDNEDHEGWPVIDTVPFTLRITKTPKSPSNLPQLIIPAQT